MAKKKIVSAEVLCWVFFGANGIKDNTDLMRCMNFCYEVENQMKMKNHITTIESLKNTSGYLGMTNDIPDSLISDEKIQKMIDFKI